MFPRIVKEFPEATLHIFTDLKSDKLESYRAMEMQISHDPSITLRGRVSQDEIAVEFLKSDVWLYPTDFTETYCITALEAQAAGLLCACTGLAALSEIVGDRGIVVGDDIEDPQVEDTLLQELVRVLRNPEEKEKLTTNAKHWAMKQSHKELACEWRKDLFRL